MLEKAFKVSLVSLVLFSQWESLTLLDGTLLKQLCLLLLTALIYCILLFSTVLYHQQNNNNLLSIFVCWIHSYFCSQSTSGVTSLHDFPYINNIWFAYSHILVYVLIKFCYNSMYLRKCARFALFCEKILVSWFSY